MGEKSGTSLKAINLNNYVGVLDETSANKLLIFKSIKITNHRTNRRPNELKTQGNKIRWVRRL